MGILGLLVGFAIILCGVAVMAQQQSSPATQPATQLQAGQGQSGQAQPGEPKLKGENEAAQSDQKISVEVKVVNILASVRDKKGKTIGDLTKDDFVLTEDGKPQEIAYFAKESDLPLRFGLDGGHEYEPAARAGRRAGCELRISRSFAARR